MARRPLQKLELLTMEANQPLMNFLSTVSVVGYENLQLIRQCKGTQVEQLVVERTERQSVNF